MAWNIPPPAKPHLNAHPPREENGYSPEEVAGGTSMSVGSRAARYVRAYSSRSTSNTGIHFLELEVACEAAHLLLSPTNVLGPPSADCESVLEVRASVTPTTLVSDGMDSDGASGASPHLSRTSLYGLRALARVAWAAAAGGGPSIFLLLFPVPMSPSGIAYSQRSCSHC